jgi:hypothetical protein
MTPQEQHVALCEFLGWYKEESLTRYGHTNSTVTYWTNGSGQRNSIPPLDHNLLSLVMEKMTVQQIKDFMAALKLTTKVYILDSNNAAFRLIRATVEEKTLALCRALRPDRWKDDAGPKA